MEVVMGERVMVRETRWCSGDEVVVVMVFVEGASDCGGAVEVFTNMGCWLVVEVVMM